MNQGHLRGFWDDKMRENKCLPEDLEVAAAILRLPLLL